MKLSESFYTCQEEGNTTGIPAYFVRLTNCSLSCGFSTKAIKDIKKHVEEFPDSTGTSDLDKQYADLYKENKSTWFCDSTSVWVTGKNITNEELEDKIYNDTNNGTLEKGIILSRILSGRIHFIFTGGEPTLPQHQKSIMGFLDYLNAKYNAKIYSEIETNGTIVTADEFYSGQKIYINQINCSPKLENSGMPVFRRINKEAIKQIKGHPDYWFKFVVSEEKDIKEIQETYLIPFGIPDERVILMPGVDSQENIFERSRFVIEMSKIYGYRSVTRGHVVAFGKTCGV